MSTRPICAEDISLTFYPHFLSELTAQHLFSQLRDKVSWHQEQYQWFGKTIPSPRLVAWYSDDAQATYKYSEITHQPKPSLPELLDIQRKIKQQLNLDFNSVLANLYRNETDSMGYHSDNEPELGKRPIIASLSLGAPRRFNLKHKKNKALHKMLLTNGSLLIMSGDTQSHWRHAVPKQKKEVGERINLTFRLIK